MKFDEDIKDNLFKYAADMKAEDAMNAMYNKIWIQKDLYRSVWWVEFNNIKLNRDKVKS